MSNYMDLIGNRFPGVGAICHGDPAVYTDVVWIDGLPLPSQAELAAAHLDTLREEKIADLSALCAYDIINGFSSAALGTVHWYDSQPEDQMNLIGAVAAGDTMVYAVRETQGGPKLYKLHTHIQLMTVIQDGRTVKLDSLQHFNTKRQAVLNAATEQAILDVQW